MSDYTVKDLVGCKVTKASFTGRAVHFEFHDRQTLTIELETGSKVQLDRSKQIKVIK